MKGKETYILCILSHSNFFYKSTIDCSYLKIMVEFPSLSIEPEFSDHENEEQEGDGTSHDIESSMVLVYV